MPSGSSCARSPAGFGGRSFHWKARLSASLFNVVDLVDKLDAEARGGRQRRTADLLCRLDFGPPGDLAACPSPGPAGNWIDGETVHRTVS